MVEDTSLCFNAYKGLPGKPWLPAHLLLFVSLSIGVTHPATNDQSGNVCSACMLWNLGSVLCKGTEHTRV